jgi:hypothetical protein
MEPFAEPHRGRGQGCCCQQPDDFPCLQVARVAARRAEDGPEGTIAVLGVGVRRVDPDVLAKHGTTQTVRLGCKRDELGTVRLGDISGPLVVSTWGLPEALEPGNLPLRGLGTAHAVHDLAGVLIRGSVWQLIGRIREPELGRPALT